MRWRWAEWLCLIAAVYGDITCPFNTRTATEIIDCSGYAQRHGKLKLKGVQLVDSFGEPIQLQGLSSFSLQYFPDCVTKESISHLVRNWGITVFRIAVSLSDTGYTINPTFFDQMIHNAVNWCEELGIYLIIDWHVLDPGDPNFYLTSRGANTGPAIDFWKRMAVLYKSRTHLIYEIANEPNGVPWNVTLEYHNAVLFEIRNIDPDTVIIAGSGHYSQDIDLAYYYPVQYPHNVLYAFHFYAASHSYLLPMFEKYSQLVPVFVSEWGLSDYTCLGEVNGEMADQFLKVFAGSNSTPAISWTIWSFSDKDETCSALTVGSCSAADWQSLSCTGLYMLNYMKDANVNGSFGCLYSTTNYPTGFSTSSPTDSPSASPAVPLSTQRTNSQIVIGFLTVYGSIVAALAIIGTLLYYLQIVYYPRRPQDKAHISDERVVTRIHQSATNWAARATARFSPPHRSTQLSGLPQEIPHAAVPGEDEEESEQGPETEMVVTNSDAHLRHSSQFVVTNPLKKNTPLNGPSDPTRSSLH
jgi:hypothetical protein